MMNGRKRVKFQQRYEKRHGSLSKDLFAKIVGPTAAERFLAKALGGKNHPAPRVINTDEHAGYPPAIMRLKADGALEEDCRHRPVQYLNNVLEQDHRAIKRRIRASQYFRSFWGACRTNNELALAQSDVLRTRATKSMAPLFLFRHPATV